MVDVFKVESNSSRRFYESMPRAKAFSSIVQLSSSHVDLVDDAIAERVRCCCVV